MLISATHTHSAPPLMGALGTDADPEYTRFVEPRLVEAIAGAVSRLAPARVGWTVVQDPDHTHCRRWILRPDRMGKDPFGGLTVRANMHPGYRNPDFVGPAGPVDPALSVVAFQSADGRPLALLANYSMHYVGAPRAAVSPDYYGPFVENIQRLTGVAIAMMSQGTSGDQHWMDYSQARKDMDARRYAGELAEIVAAAYRDIEYRERVRCAMAETKLRLGRRVPDAGRLVWAREIVARMAGAPPKNQQEVYAREQVYLAGEPERELKLQALRIGEVGIAALPNEVFAITGLKIKARSPLRPTIVMELANGAEGYIPPPEQHALGGYTTWPARTAALVPEAEPRIVDAVLGLLEAVSGKRRIAPAEDHGDYAKAILADRPMAYWHGSEFCGPAAKDASGHNRGAVYEGGVAFYLEGPSSAAFSGAGVNRAPQFAGGRLKANFSPPGDRYTLEMWFSNRLPVDARAITGTLFSAGLDRLGIGGTKAPGGKLFFSAAGVVIEGANAPPPNTWNHVVVARDRDRVAVYLNGSGSPDISGSVPPPERGGRLLVGGSEDGSASFEGRIDEVAVYGRTLDAPAALRHYRAARYPGGTPDVP
jgi:hypothetical protein